MNVCTPALSRYPSVSAFAFVFSFFGPGTGFAENNTKVLTLQVEDVGSNLAHHPLFFESYSSPYFLYIGKKQSYS
jgi:hypothetical protein